MTYVLLNVVFLAVIFITLLVTRQLTLLRRKPLLWTLLCLVVMTAVFDSIIIALGLVTYDTTKIMGIYIGRSPVEDFAYTLAVVVLVPVFWKLMGESSEK